MIELGKRRFNTTGPCFPNEHYMLDALARLPDIEPLIASGLYFVLHAARQAGKTTAVKALAKKLNAAGNVAAVYCSLEKVQGKTDSVATLFSIARIIASNALLYSPFKERNVDLRPGNDALAPGYPWGLTPWTHHGHTRCWTSHILSVAMSECGKSIRNRK